MPQYIDKFQRIAVPENKECSVMLIHAKETVFEKGPKSQPHNNMQFITLSLLCCFVHVVLFHYHGWDTKELKTV